MTDKTPLKIWIIVLPPAALFMFVGKPGGEAVQQVWNLGHVVFFAALAWLSVRLLPKLTELPFAVLASLVLTVTLIAGVGIEWIQAGIGREASVADVWRNVVGASMALAFLVPNRRRLAIATRLFVQIAAVAALVSVLYIPAIYFVDQAVVRWKFPVLADFETPFEEQRWSKGTIDDSQAASGRSMRLNFGSERYSTTVSTSLADNWSGFGRLTFEILNPAPEPLEINVRIFDQVHIANGQHYNDRFNGKYMIRQGWNSITIPLEAIASAPASRRMNVEEIANFALFTTSLEAPRIVYLDDLRLEK